MFHLTAGKHLFPPSSCKKQINKQNSYLLLERNILKERLMNNDDKNRHFVLLIIDISKHGAKEMGLVKMAGPGFVNHVTA
jgi:hypothetical protein